MSNALRGDWGVSMVTGRPVIEEILNVLPWTIELTLASACWSARSSDCRSASGRRCIATARRTTSRASSRCSACHSRPSCSAVILLLAFAIQFCLIFPVISAQTGSPAAWLRLDGAAGDQSRPDHGRLHHARDALRHARSPGGGLRAHGARQGRAGTCGDLAPRAAQRPDPDHHGGRPLSSAS